MSSPGAHALLAASAAHRWLNCTPAPMLEREFGADKASIYAEEGTLAHALAEVLILERIADRTDAAELARIHSHPLYSAEMEYAVGVYADFVAEVFNEEVARDKSTEIMTEARVDFSAYVPGGFGTSDVVLVNDARLTIIDLKFGKGVAVSAVENPQLRLYALGALADVRWLYDPREVRVVINQPRLDSISDEVLSVDALTDWGEHVVKPAAKLAAAGEGDFVPGEHCRFCKARNHCRARADYFRRLAVYDFAEPATLDDEEVGEVLKLAPELAKWAKDIQDFAQDEAVRGKSWPGFKLVEGVRRRRITDEAAVMAALKRKRYRLDDYAPRRLLTIGKLEASIGKKELAAAAGEFIETPAGAPTLVPDSDKRPALGSREERLADFD